MLPPMLPLPSGLSPKRWCVTSPPSRPSSWTKAELRLLQRLVAYHRKHVVSMRLGVVVEDRMTRLRPC